MQLQRFLGDWILTRRIEDRQAGQEGRFEGEEAFRAVPEGLSRRRHDPGLIGDAINLALAALLAPLVGNARA